MSSTAFRHHRHHLIDNVCNLVTTHRTLTTTIANRHRSSSEKIIECNKPRKQCSNNINAKFQYLSRTEVVCNDGRRYLSDSNYLDKLLNSRQQNGVFSALSNATTFTGIAFGGVYVVVTDLVENQTKFTGR
jgi:hypothetical protein